jgi:hypothetical protein
MNHQQVSPFPMLLIINPLNWTPSTNTVLGSPSLPILHAPLILLCLLYLDLSNIQTITAPQTVVLNERIHRVRNNEALKENMHMFIYSLLWDSEHRDDRMLFLRPFMQCLDSDYKDKHARKMMCYHWEFHTGTFVILHKRTCRVAVDLFMEGFLHRLDPNHIDVLWNSLSENQF